MIDKKALCSKIRDIYSDVGECGIDVSANWDADKNAWVVDLKKDGKHLTTHLEAEEADQCMEGKQCVGLGLQIAQLRDNIAQL